MSLRDSLDLIRHVRPQAGQTALQHEIAAERASSLAAAERKVKETVAAFRAAGEADREGALQSAREAVWAYFVQRELLGFRRHNDVIADLGIPAAALNGLGAMPRRSQPASTADVARGTDVQP